MARPSNCPIRPNSEELLEALRSALSETPAAKPSPWTGATIKSVIGALCAVAGTIFYAGYNLSQLESKAAIAPANSAAIAQLAKDTAEGFRLMKVELNTLAIQIATMKGENDADRRRRREDR